MNKDHMDGTGLKQAVIAGARRVIMMQENLNRINVFPVPDNDTGTNMALTMQSVAEGAISCHEVTVSGMSQCLADSALMGARGNSGAILAQFFQGWAEGFNGKATASRQHFAEAAERAKTRSYEAISEPREGTILTVIRDWADHVKNHAHLADSFLDLLHRGLKEAERSLRETPKKLKLLSAAGVVDAGAQGFVHLLEGIFHFTQSGKIEKAVGIGGAKSIERAKIKHAPHEIEFQYCTECLVEGQGIDTVKMREELKELGNSLIVAGSDRKVRIHIHTDEPKQVFAIADSYGSISGEKFDDMRLQHDEAYGEEPRTRIALVTDSSCDLTPEFIIRHNVQMVPVQISFGDEAFLDRITITPREFYRLLKQSPHYPKTSQPTPGDYLTVYNDLWGHYDKALSIHLSGALSGTLQAAKTAAAKVSDQSRIQVFDSKNTSVGLGLIVAEAARAIEEGAEIEDIVSRIQWAVDHVRFYVSFETVDYLIRGGRLSRSRGLLAKTLNAKPILTFDNEGKAVTVAKAIGKKAALEKLMRLVTQDATGKRNLRFAVAHSNAPDKANWLVQRIKREFEVKEVMVANVSPALGAHAGPGAAGVAFLGEET